VALETETVSETGGTTATGEKTGTEEKKETGEKTGREGKSATDEKIEIRTESVTAIEKETEIGMKRIENGTGTDTEIGTETIEIGGKGGAVPRGAGEA
jgi:hypothetical protein